MRRRAVLALLLLAALAVGCSGERPSLAATAAAAPAVEVPKVATPDVNTVDLAVVATASVPRLEVFDTRGATRPARTLSNPIPSGGPLVLLVEQTVSGWLRVLLPVRPNGSTGWIRASDVTLERHNYRIAVNLGEFRLDVFNAGKLIVQAPIGVARANTPTPGGRYYTTELLKPPAPNSVYGSYAYGLSGYSDVLESFNGGPGQLGIHGTNDPATIGTRVSAGCIRLRNADIERLVNILPLGVPVDVIA